MDTDSQARGPGSGPRIRRLATAIVWWIDPEENPSGLIYGTIAVGAVLAAQSSRRDTFPDTVGATVIVLGLYWIAHAYARVTGDRLRTRQALTARAFRRSLGREATIMKGAVLPVAVLLVLWAAGVSLNTGVTAALWTSAVALALFEMVTALRGHLGRLQTAVQVLVGSVLGAGILVVRLLLH